MKDSALKRLAMSLVIVAVAAPFGIADLKVGDLTCEYTKNPRGIETLKPRFGWILESASHGQLQSAYQVLVASGEEELAHDHGDKWDSGKVESVESVGIEYAGKSLVSGERCFWKVRCWDKNDEPSTWSNAARFEMGLLNQSDWQGGWIGAGSALPPGSFAVGKVGQGITLNGTSQSLRLSTRIKLKPAKAITLSAWVRPTAPLGDDWRHVYRKEDGISRQLLAFGKTGNIAGLWVGLGIGDGYVEFGATTSLSKLKDGLWHLATATYDGSAIAIYLDGQLIGSKPQTGALRTDGRAPGYLGSDEGKSFFFPGGIDDFRIYNRALAATEISDLFDSGNPVDGLMAQFKMDGNLIDSISKEPAEAIGFETASPLLRKQFKIDKPVARATAYFSGIGWSELYVNGSKVGDNVLDPITTDYDKRIFYVTHDVTAMVKQGDNVLGAMLGNGWYSEPPGPNYGDSPRMRMQMNIRFADGTGTSIVSDESWKQSTGPIIQNDMYKGEVYDARREKTGWLQSDYNDADWRPAGKVDAPGGIMQAQMAPPIKVMQTIKPVKLTNPKPGVYLYHFSQLFGGWARLRVKGPAGTKVSMEYGQRLDPKTGMIDNRRHPEPLCTDYYVLKGDPNGEVYEPRFTFHPVWYVEIEGYPGTPTLEDLDGRVVHSDEDLSGDFECSNKLFNQIHSNCTWTLRNELFGMLLDCLYREHWGWLEPASDPATLAHRKNMPMFWEKFLDDARFAQHADGVVPDVIPAYPLKRRFTGEVAWAGNYPLVAWYVYQYYDDPRVLKTHYPYLKKWMEHLIATASGDLYTEGYYGDHLLPGPEPGKEEFLSSETPKELVRTAFYYKNAYLLSKIANVLGDKADAERYSQLADHIKKAFNDKWFNSEAASYATGAQTSNVLPLAMGLVPEGREDLVRRHIVESIKHYGDHFHMGNVGTSAFMQSCPSDHGLGEVVYKVMNKMDYPGYGYMVARGATTLWEAWDIYANLLYPSRGGELGEESMSMWGVVSELFYQDLAGIRPPDYYGTRAFKPGFREIEIKPHVIGDMTWVKASTNTVRGMISSEWKIVDGTFTLNVGIPVNSVAKVRVPTFGAADSSIREGGKIVWEKGGYVAGVTGVTGAARASDGVTFEIGSGTYTFAVPVH